MTIAVVRSRVAEDVGDPQRPRQAQLHPVGTDCPHLGAEQPVFGLLGDGVPFGQARVEEGRKGLSAPLTEDSFLTRKPTEKRSASSGADVYLEVDLLLDRP